MSDLNAGTPRVYIARHGRQQPSSTHPRGAEYKANAHGNGTGETEWTINGRYTGKSELPLTPNGVRQVQETGEVLVGSGKLIDPSRFAHIFVSPRQRAQKTLDLLLGDGQKEALVREGKVTTTEDIAEWDYGDYEGLLTKEIRARRKEKALDKEKPWDIWVDGCEGGE